MDRFPAGTGLEFGELGETGLGEYEETEFGEFGESGPGEWEVGDLGEAAIPEFGEAGLGEFAETPEAHEQFLGSILGSVLGGEAGSPLSEEEQVQLASELLEISNEQELEQFLGGLFKKVARGVGSIVRSPIGRALGGVLKSVAKRALPVVGGALGSMVAPGIGTAIGSKLGSMASGLFEVQLEGMPQEQAEYEVARRYVNLAAAAARHAATARPRPGLNPRTVARAAVARAARAYAPGIYRSMVRSLRAGAAPYGYRRPYVPLGVRPGRAAYPTTVPYGAPVGAPPPADGSFGGGMMPAAAPGIDVGPAAGVPLSGRWVRRGRKIVVLGV